MLWPRRPGRWPTGSGRAAGSSPSATAAAPPTPRGRSSCSATRPRGRPLPAISLVDDRAVLTALANDVGFELVFSRQIIAHARPGDIAVGFSTSGDSLNVLRALERGGRTAAPDDRLRAVTTAAPWRRSDAVRYCLVVRSDSVHRIQETQYALVLELWSTVQRSHRRREHAMTDVVAGCRPPPDGRPRSSTASRRSAAADRACADDVVTLAHGAGGKASAALLDAVFLPAFSNDVLAARTDAAESSVLPSGERWRSAPTRSSSSRCVFPGGSAGHLAVHGTVNDLAMMGARPIALSAAFVLEEGFPDRVAPRDRRRHGRGGG